MQDFLSEAYKRIYNQELQKGLTVDDFLQKLRTSGSIERTVMINFKMCCFMS